MQQRRLVRRMGYEVGLDPESDAQALGVEHLLWRAAGSDFAVVKHQESVALHRLVEIVQRDQLGDRQGAYQRENDCASARAICTR